MALIVPIHNTYAKTDKGYCSSVRFGETPLLIFQNSSWFARNLSRKGVQNWRKQFFCYFGEGVLEEGEWFLDPSLGGKWY